MDYSCLICLPRENVEKEDLKKSKAEMKASLYYQSCMDKDEIQTKLGAEPLIKLLAEVGGWYVSNFFIK